MREQLKERLTGAAVLVILGALLIPEFLSGPPADDLTGTEELLLPAADAQPVRSHTIRLDQKQAAAQPPVAQVVRSESQTARSQAGGWAVQAGSFSRLENARRLSATLQSMGYDSFISETLIDDRKLHRVRIGPLANRKAADRIANELQQQGQQAESVPHP